MPAESMDVQNEKVPNPLLILADDLVDIRTELDQIGEREKELNERKSKIEQQLIEMMVNEEVEKFTRNGNTFYPTVKTYASIKAEYKEEVFTWMKENGFADLVKEQVNAQSLTSWYKEQTEEGELPEEISEMLSTYDKTSITVRKGRK